jgi:serine/threonine protein kinase/Tol biopolymer transport system component
MSNLIGQSIGRYRILDELGKGGMAIVYKAYDTRLEREVAIKFIRRGAFPPDQLDGILKRFEREAKALAKLSHPNIVRVLDYGEHEDSPYLVMEYLPAGTLKYRLGKPMPWQDAVRLLIPIAHALEYAHEHDVIHRDIKPSNILLTEKGQPMLTDFGIAKVLEVKETTSLTSTGIGLGTPEYMSPEQWTGQTTPQSDIYSLGVVFYEMVTGHKPYEADTPAEILLKQAYEPLPRPKSYVRNLPDAVENVILKALAKKASDRYQDMSEVIGALTKLVANGLKLKGRPTRARTDETVDEFETKTQTDPFEGIPTSTSKSPHRRLFWLIGAGTAAITLICGLFGWLLRGQVMNVFRELELVSTPIGGGSGQIAFVVYPHGELENEKAEIYVMNADGSGRTRLADGWDPRWSPDGQQIAFNSNRRGTKEIYIMNANGSGQTRLADGWDPRWSPDGQQIAFCLGEKYKDSQIYTINEEGSDLTRLAEGFNPIWSPDGQRIAFSSNSYPYEIFIVNTDGSGKTHLGADGQQLAWSPDGTRIAFMYRDIIGIHVINVDGTGETTLTHGLAFQPEWSPDGRMIAFSEAIMIGDSKFGKALFTVKANGSGESHRLIENTSSDQIYPNPVWSPDGAHIAFISDRDGNPEIYVMNSDGSGQTRLTNNTGYDSSPAWRP